MRKRSLVVGLFFVFMLVCCMNAYAAMGGECTAWDGFWNSVGGFLYNALPWNWGNWVGK